MWCNKRLKITLTFGKMSSVHLFSLMKWWHYIYTIIRLNKVTCQNLLKKARGTKSSPPVSKTSADTLKTDSKLQKIHKLFVNITSQVKILQEFTSMQVTMMQNSQKKIKMCLWTCKGRALFKLYYMAFCMWHYGKCFWYHCVLSSGQGLMHNSEIWSACCASVVS